MKILQKLKNIFCPKNKINPIDKKEKLCKELSDILFFFIKKTRISYSSEYLSIFIETATKLMEDSDLSLNNEILKFKGGIVQTKSMKSYINLPADYHIIALYEIIHDLLKEIYNELLTKRKF